MVGAKGEQQEDPGNSPSLRHWTLLWNENLHTWVCLCVDGLPEVSFSERNTYLNTLRKKSHFCIVTLRHKCSFNKVRRSCKILMIFFFSVFVVNALFSYINLCEKREFSFVSQCLPMLEAKRITRIVVGQCSLCLYWCCPLCLLLLPTGYADRK